MIKQNDDMRGFSMWISFGKYAGWRIETGFTGPTMLRVVLGWVSFVLITVDVDQLVGTLVTEADALRKGDSQSTTH